MLIAARILMNLLLYYNIYYAYSERSRVNDDPLEYFPHFFQVSPFQKCLQKISQKSQFFVELV